MKMLAMVSAIALLAACENAPKNDANANGTGGNLAPTGVASNTQMSAGPNELAPGVSDRIFYDTDSSVVNAEGQSTLQKQADYLKQHPAVTVTVEGHCDERGTREYNLALGERRAAAAKNYLVSLGVDANHIQTVSYGKERPAVTGSDESAWSQNRRAVTVPNAGSSNQ